MLGMEIDKHPKTKSNKWHIQLQRHVVLLILHYGHLFNVYLYTTEETSHIILGTRLSGLVNSVPLPPGWWVSCDFGLCVALEHRINLLLQQGEGHSPFCICLVVFLFQPPTTASGTSPRVVQIYVRLSVCLLWCYHSCIPCSYLYFFCGNSFIEVNHCFALFHTQTAISAYCYLPRYLVSYMYHSLLLFTLIC